MKSKDLIFSKEYAKTLAFLVVSVIFIMMLSSCFLFETAAVEVAFDNVTDSSRTIEARSFIEQQTPTIFDVKITTVYLTEKLDSITGNNTGFTTAIYKNPAGGGSIHIDPSTLSYFDFTQPSDIVNEQLNAETELIPALTYEYVRIEFYNDSKFYIPDDFQNVRWGTEDFTKEFWGTSGVLTVKFDEPLVVKDGQTVKVVLEYNLNNTIAVLSNDGNFESPNDQYDDFYSTDSYDYEFVMPEFFPKAIIVE